MHRTLQKQHPAARLGLAVGIGFLLSVCLCLPMAGIALCLPSPMRAAAPMGEGIFCVAAFCTALIGATLADGAKLPHGLCAAGLYVLLPTVVGICFGGSFLHTLAVLLLAVFFAAVGALLGSREKKRRRKRR